MLTNKITPLEASGNWTILTLLSPKLGHEWKPLHYKFKTPELLMIKMNYTKTNKDLKTN